MSKIYQVVLKRKDNDYEEVVGQSFEREEAFKARDHYNEHEDNPAIYYLMASVVIPKAKKRVKY